MTRSAVFKLVRSAARQLSKPRSISTGSSPLGRSSLSIVSRPAASLSIRGCKAFSTTSAAFKGLSPESEDPQPKEAEGHDNVAKPAELTAEQYHELADAYMDTLVERMEQLQEESDQVDVEYSVIYLPSLL